MSKKDNQLTIKFDKDTISRIDFLIEQKKFDTRSQFIRRAAIEYLSSFEQKILA